MLKKFIIFNSAWFLAVGLLVLFALPNLNSVLAGSQTERVAESMPAIVLNDAESYQVWPSARFFEDASAERVVDDFINTPENYPFQKLDDERAAYGAPNFGVTDKAYWVKFKLSNTTDEEDLWVLYLRFAMISELSLYRMDNGFATQLYRTGLRQRWSSRLVNDSAFVLPLTLPAKETTFLLRVRNEGALQVPISVWRLEAIAAARLKHYRVVGLYYGLLLSMVIYNLFVWFSTQERAYLFYVGYIAVLLVAVAFHDGSIQQLLPSLSGWWAYQVINPLIALVIVFACLFTRDFLQLKQHAPDFERLALLTCVGCMGFVVVSPFMSGLVSAWVILALIVWFLALVVSCGVVSWQHKVQNAPFFLLAWLAMVVGSGLSTLMHLGLFPAIELVDYGVHLGTASEALLLSLALANRINYLKKQQIEASEQVNRALETANRELQKSNQMKDEFLSLLSHELRTPMHGIIGGLNLVKTEKEPEKTIDLIERASREMLSQIEKLLLYSELQGGRFKPQKEKVSLSRLFEALVADFKKQAQHKYLHFTYVLSPNLPKSVLIDHKTLTVVLGCLLDNAVKFTVAGEIKLSIKHHFKQPGQLLITVQDTGVGIRKELQLDNRQAFDINDVFKRSHDGLGIGIALCQQLAEAVGGDLQLESQVNVGTQVSLSWPFAEVCQESIAEPTDIDWGQYHCLVVEDNAVNQTVLSRYLVKLGMKYSLVANGQEALEFIENQQTDLILMDCHMPVMNGYECARNIRQIDGSKSAIPIIAITADATHQNREVCLASGMNDVLFKPLSYSRLCECLTHWASQLNQQKN